MTAWSLSPCMAEVGSALEGGLFAPASLKVADVGKLEDDIAFVDGLVGL